jgi:prepilin-type N-terminal cleavage/methylation domain-containing protein
MTRCCTHRGFSLVELLATIGIIAVLFALLLPALRSTRKSAIVTRHLSNMRECSNTISLYSQAYRDSFPFMGVPGQPEQGVAEFNDLIPPDAGMSYNAQYFAANAFHWPTVVKRAGFDIALTAEPDDEAREALLDRYGTSDLLRASYQLSHTLVATPEYWQLGPAPISTPSYFQATRTHQVRYTSSKGTLLATRVGMFDQSSSDAENWVLVGFADNSVFKKDPPLEHGLQERPFACWNTPVLTTVDGIRGRDY